MLWKRKILYYTATLAGGGCTLALSKNAVVEKYENVSQQNKPSVDISSYIDVPEISGEYFYQETESHWLPIFHNKSPVCWKLFMLSKSKRRSDRHKAIKLLSDLTKLGKWEYMMIAQACGPSTAVGLARSTRMHKYFFLLSPFRTFKEENLNKDILDMISFLPLEDVDPCVQVLTKEAKLISQRILKNGEDVSTEVENSFAIYHSERKKKATFAFDKLCLQVILGHSAIKSHRDMMIKCGILKFLWEILERRRNDTEFQCLTAQILANFALEKEFKNALYTTGWIGILASWSRSPYININLPSAKALANLDSDDYNHALYDSGIYLLHPTTRSNEKDLCADIIFVHGLLGATFWTWRQNDTMKNLNSNSGTPLNSTDVLEQPIMRNHSSEYTFCWPKDWLAMDFPNFRYISIDYNTGVSNWRSQCPQQKEKDNINIKAKQLIDKLIKANVGSRPIIWVTHSMGGILVKQLLVEAAASDNTNANLITKNTTGIIFFSVPHRGSEVATLMQSIPYVFQPTVDISQLHKGSSILLTLHDKFKELVQKNNIGVLSFGETKKSKWGFNLVSEDSSNPGFGEFYPLPVDHLSTCKPESPDSKVYSKILEFLKAHISTPVIFSTRCPIFEISNILCLIP